MCGLHLLCEVGPSLTFQLMVTMSLSGIVYEKDSIICDSSGISPYFVDGIHRALGPRSSILLFPAPLSVSQADESRADLRWKFRARLFRLSYGFKFFHS
jgi:hypothetical protein